MSKQKKAAAKERVKPVTAVSQAASRDEVAVGGGHDSVLTTIEASSTAVAPTRALVPVPSSAKQHPLPLTGFVTHKTEVCGAKTHLRTPVPKKITVVKWLCFIT